MAFTVTLFNPPVFAEDTLNTYYQQTLNWSPCYTDFECTNFKVPIDYAALSKGATTLRAIRSANPSNGGYLFSNPGGPGVSTIDFIRNARSFFPISILSSYRLIGFDQRGIGQSSAIRCLTDAQEDTYQDSWVKLSDSNFVNKLQILQSNYVQSCLKATGENVGQYSTWQSARDLDLLRSLVGSPKLNYYGASYGTLLGVDYLEQFPNLAGKIILDGAVNPLDSTINSSISQSKSFDLEYLAFSRKYPIWNEARLLKLISQIISGPAINWNSRTLTYPIFITAIADTLYSPASGWRELNTTLTNYVNYKNPADIFALSDDYFERDTNGHYSNLQDIGTIMACEDAPDRPTYQELPNLAKELTSQAPIFGPYEAESIALCANFPTPNSLPVFQHSKNLSPVLIFGNTHDPATPIAQARGLTKLINNSHLVTLNTDGHISLNHGSTCIDEIATKYLESNTLSNLPAFCNLDSTSA